MKSAVNGEALLEKLPAVRGRLEPNFPLAEITWFRAGGMAEVLFTPADEEDLADFLAELPEEVGIYPIGVGSNLLVRDGGVPGVVVRLGRGFGQIEVRGEGLIFAGAGVPDVKVARFALDHGIGGLTFLRGIPGTIGGALRMNGGAYGGETKDVVVEVRAIDRKGNLVLLQNTDMHYSYRHCGAPDDLIFTAALLKGHRGDPGEIAAAMEEITSKREATQPVRSRTGGSTFKNPPGHKAWRLIDDAGLRGYAIGPAKVSELHCNFLINEGGATAAEIEELGETIRRRVKERSGVDLDWEIKRIGLPST